MLSSDGVESDVAGRYWMHVMLVVGNKLKIEFCGLAPVFPPGGSERTD